MSLAHAMANRHGSSKGLRQLSVRVALVVSVVAACGGPSAGPSTSPTLAPQATTPASIPLTAAPTQPAAPGITGTVNGDDGRPLFAMGDQEVLIVGLVCPDGQSGTRCFPKITQDMDFDGLYASVCDSADASACPVSLGQGAARVGPDGRYALADVPAGTYGLVLLYSFPDIGGYSVRGYSIKRDVAVQTGTSTGHDFTLDLHRE